jgi:hypothetical protein
VISLVIESWNIKGEREALARLLAKLAPHLGDAELVITVGGLITDRHELEAACGRAIKWVELSEKAGYYEHKNRGFDASTGDVVAFIDGDCDPCPGWLTALVLPILLGEAKVVAGATTYAGELAPLASLIDFPYFGHDRDRDTVRNFFANNVAFAREVFAARRYPDLAPMFHGQCQVLGLQLLADKIPIRFAKDARVIHAWPGSALEWTRVRLLRGADLASLLPHVAGHYAPRTRSIVARLGPLPALAVVGLRAVTATAIALRKGPVVRNLVFIAGVTVVDSLGIAARPAVYRTIGSA